jgi:putative amidase-like protein
MLGLWRLAADWRRLQELLRCWYSSTGSTRSGQTRTWTQAMALHYFLQNRGRAFQPLYLNQLWKGDVITVDWERNGSIDHSMVVDDVRGAYPSLGDIFVSYHSNNTYHRPLAELYYPNGNPPQSWFYAWQIWYNW